MHLLVKSLPVRHIRVIVIINLCTLNSIAKCRCAFPFTWKHSNDIKGCDPNFEVNIFQICYKWNIYLPLNSMYLDSDTYILKFRNTYSCLFQVYLGVWVKIEIMSVKLLVIVMIVFKHYPSPYWLIQGTGSCFICNL